MKYRYKQICLILTIVTMTSLSYNCTYVYKQPVHNIYLPDSHDKIHLSINLIISEDLKNTTWDHKIEYTTHSLQLGGYLVSIAEKLARNVFTDVSINGICELPNTNTKYILFPKLIYAGHVLDFSNGKKMKTSIAIEWKLKKQSGQTVWQEATTGTYVGKMKGNFNENAREHFKRALFDLAEKSQEEFLSSKLLRSLQHTDQKGEVYKQPDNINDDIVIDTNFDEENKPESFETAERIRLAIFPIHMYTAGAKYLDYSAEETTVLAVEHTINDSKVFTVTHSYYVIASQLEISPIYNDIIPNFESQDLWIKKSFQPEEPKIEFICEIGKQLNVDAVFISSIISSGTYTVDAKYYIIDIGTRMVYMDADRISNGRFRQEINNFTKNFFSDCQNKFK